jgi:hypothetical protein
MLKLLSSLPPKEKLKLVATMVESKELEKYSKLESDKFWEIVDNLVRGVTPLASGGNNAP